MTENFQTYFKEIQNRYKTLDTTEFSYRTPFENFIKNLNKDCTPHQGSKTEKQIGAPDFKIFKASQKIGYIETKDLGSNLDEILISEQIRKYIKGINNLILSNYLRFILLRHGEKIFDLSLFNISDLPNPKFKISQERIVEFRKMFDTFFNYKSLSINTSEVLANELAKRAILIKDIAKEQLEEDIIKVKNNESYSSIFDFYKGLEELVHDITIDDCVDAYAQTITYGLFGAKLKCKGELTREFVEYYLPKNIPVIKRIFTNIAGDYLPPSLTWIVDDTLDILNVSDITAIMSEMNERGKKDRDPFSHFYEDFLKLYDPSKREMRGVYYTPRPVVNYIVKSVEWIIKNNFNKHLGFADDDVTVLDPATGTGTFLWLAYARTLEELKEQRLSGIRDEKIKNHLLKNFYGFEILITPYIIAHLKLAWVLSDRRYELTTGERIQVYLTNTLEPIETTGLLQFLGKELNEERRVANEVITKKQILAIIGNPPYSGMSVNKGKWIDDLLKNGYTRADGSKDDGYYKADGQPLGERNPKMLQDDYVKFIRFAQWKIDKSGFGVIGFITNNGYLDNVTFRGMRESLLQSFERIYILNLHGSSRKKEKSHDDKKDENVFDIQQGVAITLFIKNPNISDTRVFYSDIFGLKEEKCLWLDRHDIYKTDWTELKPSSPYNMFVPFDSEHLHYEQIPKITDIFPIYSVGIDTGRYDFTIKPTQEEIWMLVNNFVKMDIESARQFYHLPQDTRDWKIHLAQKDLPKNDLNTDNIIPISCRPFDKGFTYYTGRSRGFHSMPRNDVMQHMIKNNLGILTNRQVSSGSWNHVLITDSVTESCYISNKTKEHGYLFPLYIFDSKGARTPNINLEILNNLSNKYKNDVSPEDIFYYIYGIFHSSEYRVKYEEILKIDFPRIPFSKDYSAFSKIVQLGKDLADLHLMKKQLSSTIKFEISGSKTIDTSKYIGGKVFINKSQYFDDVPEHVWNFYIGSYRVLDYWLKSRKNRQLSSQEISRFIQIVEIIKETIHLMEEIDKIDFLSERD